MPSDLLKSMMSLLVSPCSFRLLRMAAITQFHMLVYRFPTVGAKVAVYLARKLAT
ncbi:hypothetical protein LCGC14_3044240, partial [marine sediment metagenome]